MRVIKVVAERGKRLVSTFAEGKWKKEYAKGVETKPDTGYLFAYPRRDIKRAKRDMSKGNQYWLAEAEVVGSIYHRDISSSYSRWHDFWEGFKPQSQMPDAEYLLCSSITLIRVLD